MERDTVVTILKMVGMRHTNLMEFWADLMNYTKGQIAGWLVNIGIKDMKELIQYLRPNQIANIES